MEPEHRITPEKPAESQVPDRRTQERLYSEPSVRREPAPQSLPETVGAAVTSLSDGLSTLVRGHLELARVEMAHDFKALGKDLGIAFAGTPPLMVGYLLLWVSIGALLALAMQPWVAFLICAVANFVIGATLMVLGRRRSKRDRIGLSNSTEELRKDRQWLPTLRESPETLRGHLH